MSEMMKEYAALARRALNFANATDEEALALIWVNARTEYKESQYMINPPSSPESCIVDSIRIGRLAAEDKDVDGYKSFELPAGLTSGVLEEPQPIPAPERASLDELSETFVACNAAIRNLIKALSTAKSHKPTCGLNVGCE